MSKIMLVLLSLCVVVLSGCPKPFLPFLNPGGHLMSRDGEWETDESGLVTGVCDTLSWKREVDPNRKSEYRCISKEKSVKNLRGKSEEQVSKAIKKAQEICTSNAQIWCTNEKNIEPYEASFKKCTEDYVERCVGSIERDISSSSS